MVFAVVLVDALLILPGSGSGPASDSALNRRTFDRLLSVLASAVAEKDIRIAYCSIPNQPRVSPLESGVVPEIQENYGAVSTALGLAKLSVSEKLRGDMDSILFICKWAVMREGLPATPFMYQPGSSWVFFLEDPLRSANKHSEILRAKYADHAAGTFLSPRNFFAIYDQGDGGICISWPDSARIANRPPLVIGAGFVEDLKVIVNRVRAHSAEVDSAGLQGRPSLALRTEYGRLLYEKVFGER